MRHKEAGVARDHLFVKAQTRTPAIPWQRHRVFCIYLFAHFISVNGYPRGSCKTFSFAGSADILSALFKGFAGWKPALTGVLQELQEPPPLFIDHSLKFTPKNGYSQKFKNSCNFA